MSAPAQICYFADAGFEHCTLVSLASLLETTRHALAVSLFLDAPSPWAEGRIAALRRAHGDRAELHLRPLPDLAGRAGQRGHISGATLARLHLPDLMSGRVLHLDGDTLIRADLGAVTGHDLGSALIAGVRSEYFWRARRAAERLPPGPWRAHFARQAAKARVAGQDLGGCYINAGVVLYDLDRIAGTSLEAEMKDTARAEGFRLRDQDLLNLVFRDRIDLLPPEYNSVWGAVATGAWPLTRSEREAYRAARRDPAVLHFAGRRKPWNSRGGWHPARRAFVREWQAAAARLEALPAA